MTRDTSWVDRIWSVAPVAWFASRAHFADARLDLMLLVVTAWGLRLTYNYARKGGHRRGGEDYRWPILREPRSVSLRVISRVDASQLPWPWLVQTGLRRAVRGFEFGATRAPTSAGLYPDAQPTRGTVLVGFAAHE